MPARRWTAGRCASARAGISGPGTYYEDNDRSAFSGKLREDYQHLLKDVKAGLIDVIVCWHPDRLHRSPRELEGFIELLEVTGVTVATVTAGDRDFATPNGRWLARMEGANARRESEQKSDRITRKHLQLARREPCRRRPSSVRLHQGAPQRHP